MFKDIIQGIITLFIWAVCGVIAIGVNVDAVSFWGAIVAIVALSMAMGATAVIWGDGESDFTDEGAASGAENDDYYREKRKRGAGDTKAEMLLALMDEDERQAFKQALQQRMLESSARLGDDGEINTTTLESLLQSDQEHQQR